MKEQKETEIIDVESDALPPKKKLKQARLPFQVISPGAKPAHETASKKKRKLSDESEDSLKVTKIVRCDGPLKSLELKENLCKPLEVDSSVTGKELGTETSTKSSNNDDDKNITTKKNESSEICKKITENGPVESDDLVSVVDLTDESSVCTRLQVSEENKFNKSKNKTHGSDNDSPNVKTPLVLTEKESCKSESNNSENEQSDQESSTSCSADEIDHVAEITPSRPVKQKKGWKSKGNQSNKTEANNTGNKQLHKEKSVGYSSDKTCNSSEVTPVRPEQQTKSSKSKENRSSKRKLSTGQDSPNSSGELTTPKVKKLTPKQLQKQIESAKRREEKEKLRLEKERKKAEEKEEKNRQKIEKEELKRKEKEEKEEQRKREKEEKERKKQAELELKLEEKKQKEEERKQKEEEKKQKEEEKRKKEEQRLLEKRKKDEKKQAEEDAKRKAAAAFTTFFLPRKSDIKNSEEIKLNPSEMFMPFEIKSDMRLAPLCRVDLDSNKKQELDKQLSEQNASTNYLIELKKKTFVPRRSFATWPVSEKSDVIYVEQDDQDEMSGTNNQVIELHPDINLPRPKLLQFWENRRPPYWGTWRKKSEIITRKRPLSRDEKLFDYEVDSDEEWEEEEPGESLHGSDDEKESEDEYEVDNDFFVPHGYLSDEENVHGDEDDEEDRETISPESQKAKLKLLELEFEEEMKHKTERLKPRIIGCIWTHKNSDAVGAQLLKLLSTRRAVYRDGPIITSKPDEICEAGTPKQDTLARGPKRKKFPESAIPALIKLIHGNTNGTAFLVKEFIAYHEKEASKEMSNSENEMQENKEVEKIRPISVKRKIKELAEWKTCPDEGSFNGRMCWYVSAETRSFYGLSELCAGNKQWEYNLTPRRRDPVEISPGASPVSVQPEPKPSPLLITNFTKKLSKEEIQKQLKQADIPSPEVKPASGIKTFFSKTTTSIAPKKRVAILASTARGKELPKSTDLIHSQKPLDKSEACNASLKRDTHDLPLTEESKPTNSDLPTVSSESPVKENCADKNRNPVAATKCVKAVECIDLTL